MSALTTMASQDLLAGISTGLMVRLTWSAYRKLSKQTKDAANLLIQIKTVNPGSNIIKIRRSKGKLIFYREVHYINQQEEAPKVSPRSARAAARLLGHYKDHEVMLGDLDELYGKIQAEHGPLFAKVWYWKQTMATVLVLTKTRLMKWSLIIALGEKVARLIR